jgi:hypothetical protein
VSRRAALPGANELFRTTSSTLEAAPEPVAGQVAPTDGTGGAASDPAAVPAPSGSEPTKPRLRRVRSSALEPSGRERHDEKITVYVSSEELMALEDARVTLYRDHGVKIDRGRIVREAIALVMSDLQTKGTSSILVRRLTER